MIYINPTATLAGDKLAMSLRVSVNLLVTVYVRSVGPLEASLESVEVMKRLPMYHYRPHRPYRTISYQVGGRMKGLEVLLKKM